MTQLSNVLITDNSMYYQNKLSVIKTFDNCVFSKADLRAIGWCTFWFVPFLVGALFVGNVISTSETARFSKVEVLVTRLKTLIARKSALK